jgi:hypothetical protein
LNDVAEADEPEPMPPELVCLETAADVQQFIEARHAVVRTVHRAYPTIDDLLTVLDAPSSQGAIPVASRWERPTVAQQLLARLIQAEFGTCGS